MKGHNAEKKQPIEKLGTLHNTDPLMILVQGSHF